MSRRLTLALVLTLTVGALALMGTGPVDAQERGEQPVRCAQACREQAQAEMRACLATGAAPERCRQRAQTYLEKCMARCKRAEAKPVPSEEPPRACERRCEMVGQAVMRACMALPIGPTREQCQKRAAEAVRLCIEKTCPKKERPDPDPATCQEKCAQRAREFYQKCTLGSTGATPPEDCAKKARELHQECLQRCKRASVAPEPAKPGPEECRERCAERVENWIEQCMTQPGATLDRCEEQGARKLEACIAGCP